MKLTNQHHSFLIRITAFGTRHQVEEYEDFVIDEHNISTLNIQDLIDELEEQINNANDHIIDRLEND